MCLCRCKPGFYNLGEANPEGCQACFCFGHSLACSSSSHHVVANISSDFMEGITQQVSSLSMASLLSSHHMLCIIILFRTRKSAVSWGIHITKTKAWKTDPKMKDLIQHERNIINKYQQLFISYTLSFLCSVSLCPCWFIIKTIKHEDLVRRNVPATLVIDISSFFFLQIKTAG